MLFAPHRSPGETGARADSSRLPLVLVSGLAGPAETWYCNADTWRRDFDVYTPNLLAYDGAALHQRIAAGLPIDIDYLVSQLHAYLDEIDQAPPYHLVVNSLGGKVAVAFAARYPDLAARLVLVCPSGLSDMERLPVIDGVRRKAVRSLVASVFHDPRHANPNLIAAYERRFADRRWRRALLHTVRGTTGHRVRDQLAQLAQPTLVIVGRNDRIVDPVQSIEAARRLPNGRLVVLDDCGHAAQIEQAAAVNRFVVAFVQEASAPGAAGARR